MKSLKCAVSAVLAGMSVGFGGVVFLSVENKVIGSILFTVGLFVVCTFGFNLFTGKVCYVFENDWKYALNLILIWLGNLIGTGLVAAAVRFSRIYGICDRAASMCQIKSDDNVLSLFILGVLCNIFIYIGIDGYRNNPHELGKYLSLFFGVTVFILCGTEHCVADMFYFWVADAWSLKSIGIILVITIGNAVGGIFFPVAREFTRK